jgi:glycosyltransferase involved in cell wall biosynthesis
MKIIAVIPTYGRPELLRITVKRLYEKNKVNDVICVGSNFSGKALYRYHDNQPLGRKWNYGFTEARKLKADAVLYVGSSDWVSDNWIEVMMPYLKDYDMVGKLDYNLAHVTDQIKLLKFKGYTDPKWSIRTLLIRHSMRHFLNGNDRTGEPIGIGRLIRAEVLDKMDWKPFYDDYNSSMDWCMMKRIKAVGGNFAIHKGEDIQSLAVSCNLWGNMHWSRWEQFMPNMERIKDPKWIETWFPELPNFQKSIL